MSIPTNTFHWADTVSSNVTKVDTPPSGKMDVGFSVNEHPPAQFVNWLLWTIGLWLVWLKSYLTGTQTVVFGALNAFSGAPLDAGDIGGECVGFSGAGTYYGTVQLPLGCTVTAVRAYIHIDAGNTGANEVRLYVRRAHTDGTAYDILNGIADNVGSASGAGFKSITYTVSANGLISSAYYLQLGIGGAHASHRVFSIQVDYTLGV